MTRVNQHIEPQKLVNKHLFAEYREIKRIPNTIKSGKAVIKDIPKNFTLGKGHVKYYYNKLGFIKNRIGLLYEELIKRGYNIEDYRNVCDDVPQELMNDVEYDFKAVEQLKDRIGGILLNMKNIKYYKEEISSQEAIDKLK
jgi:hypothetical protein